MNRSQPYRVTTGAPGQDRHSGFTLIELLVVISIISLLIALLLPALSKAKASAANVKCLSNERQVNVALNMYFASNQDRFPLLIGENAAMTIVSQGPQILLTGLLTGEEPRIYIDGTGKKSLYSQVRDGPDVLKCPDQAARGVRAYSFEDAWTNSYAFNSNDHWLGAAWGRRYKADRHNEIGNGDPGEPQIISRISEIDQASERIMADERPNELIKYDRFAMDLTNPSQKMSGNNPVPGAGYYGIPIWSPSWVFEGEEDDFLNGRHGLTHNIMYGDGHAKSNTAQKSKEDFHDKKYVVINGGGWYGLPFRTPNFAWNLFTRDKFLHP